MKTSLIISVYKNTKDLEVVLNALNFQSVLPNEIIISEDGDSEEMKSFVDNYISNLNIIHLTQPDIGWQKNKALNNAIKTAQNSYLIFIDGDCVLHHKFIENHVAFSESNMILAGKRIKLGPAFSNTLRKMPLLEFENSFLTNVFSIFKDKVKFFEEGIYVDPQSLMGVVAKKRKIKWIKGCNFSCYKAALIAINGFDEDYVRPAIGEDIDLVWRFEGLGFQIKSVKNFAVQYHLHHQENWSSLTENDAMMKLKQQSKNYKTINGIEKLL